MKRELFRIAAMIAALAMGVGLAPAWMGGRAAAQQPAAGTGGVAGLVKDAQGKPVAGMTISMEPTTGGIPIEVTTDAEGKFKKAGIPAGNYMIVYKEKDVAIVRRQMNIAANRETKADLNMADPDVAAYIAKTKKDNEDEVKIGKLKTHFGLGVAALTKEQALHDQMVKSPADQKEALQTQIEAQASEAMGEFQQALAAVDPKDVNNHVVVLNNMGAVHEAAGKYGEAAKVYQESVTLKPDAGIYNNLGNDLAKSGKMPEAKAAYEKSAELDPAGAAKAYRNFGVVMFNAGTMKDSPAVDLLKKATELEPNNQQGWFLLGSALSANMVVKQEGEKITFIILPGTVEAFQKCIALDAKGAYADQSRAQLEELKAYGAGVDTKVTVPKVKH